MCDANHRKTIVECANCFLAIIADEKREKGISIKNDMIDLIDNIEKEIKWKDAQIENMQKQIEYWKLSFIKQCEATK